MSLRRPSVLWIALAAFLVHVPASAQSFDRKVDRGLRDALEKGGATQKVIVSVNAGCRDYVRAALQNHGDHIKSEHQLIDALAVELHSEDVAELANQNCIKALSYDAPVIATGHQ